MIRLSKEQVKLLHTQLIRETGGLDGVRDERLLNSALSLFLSLSLQQLVYWSISR